MKNIVYFDVETQRSISDVGGYKNCDQLKVSVAVAYSTKTGKYHIFGEEGMDALVQMLLDADLVVGYNHIGFDYKVLQGYTIMDMESQTINCDMMIDIQEIIDRRLKLDSIAEATLGMKKTADGLEALRWWKEYKNTVYEYGVKHGHIKYADKLGGIEEVSVGWK